MSGRDRRWTLIRATDIFGSDSKPDVLDIRGITAAAKDVNGKRKKYRTTVNRSGITIHGSKPCPNTVDGNTKLHIEDPRAPSLTINYLNDQFRMMPSIERFSAHTGVCQILGSKNIRGDRYQLKLGDIVRFGSVGLLVTEIDSGDVGQSDGCMSQLDINNLTHRVICHDEELNVDNDSGNDTEDENSNEDNENNSRNSRSSKKSIEGTDEEGERLSSLRGSMAPICYVCYDTNEADNPLISPCLCLGDTKYIHVNCLKKWNTSGDKNDVCTIIDEKEARTCSICKSAYPSKAKLNNGRSVSLLPDRLPTPNITFQVITKHSSTSLSCNAKYQLSFQTLLRPDENSTSGAATRPLVVGRSSQCDMVLKYRTVSTIHAEIHFSNGEFYVKDAGSSNGTLRYIYKPMNFQCGRPVHVKFGRTILSMKPSRKLRIPTIFSNILLNRSAAGDLSTPASIENATATASAAIPTIVNDDTVSGRVESNDVARSASSRRNTRT